MTTRLEQMPDKSNYYALLHGPIVLAAKTNPFLGEKLNFLADDARMGHVAQGPVCPLESAPMLVSDTKDFLGRFRPVKGKPLTFTARGAVHGSDATPSPSRSFACTTRATRFTGRRRYAAVEADKLGYGGTQYIGALFAMDAKTIRQGLADLDEPEDPARGRIRKKGAGAKLAS